MATSIIKLHTFSGAGDNGPPCFLIQVDDFYCLLDCGCQDDIPNAYIKELAKWVKLIDAVLISHPSMRHLGLLPILVGKYGLKCPIYATTPVYKLGHLVLYDYFQSRYIAEDFSSFSLDDIDSAFELFVQIKYQQTVSLQGRGHGLSVTPLPSGHMLGGTIWKLMKDETDIIYAIDFNHKKSRHLNGATFDACIRPRLLIVDVSNALFSHPRRKNREENLRQILLKTLRRGGNVLIAVDTAGYCLEIAHLLETLWHSQDSGFMAYGLAMLSHVALNVFDFTKSLVEWMSDKIVRTFEDQRSNPFNLRHLQLCHTLNELDFVPDPKVILASEADLRNGYSRLLFAEWCESDLNTVVVTSRDGDFRQVEDIQKFVSSFSNDSNPSLGRRLIGLANNEQWAKTSLSKSSVGAVALPFTLTQRVIAESTVEPSSQSSLNMGTAQRNQIQSWSRITQNGDKIQSACGMNENHMAQTGRYASRVSSIETTKRSFTAAATGSDVDEDEDDLEDDVDRLINPKIRLTSASGLVDREDLGGLSTPGTCYQPYNLSSSNTSVGRLTMLTHGRHQAGYDIFPGAYNHSGGHFFRMAKRTQLVFPSFEKTIQWDEYGERVDTAVYKLSAEPIDMSLVNKRQKQSTRADLSRLFNSSGLEKQSSVNDSSQFELTSATQDQLLDLLVLQNSTTMLPDTKVPAHFTTKCVVQKLELPVNCELSFVDYESRSDGEALKKIITGLRPQEVIFVGATKPAIDLMAEHCRSVLQLKHDLIHTPHGGDVVNCTKEGDIYQARMKDSLVTGLKFTKIREYELAWVEADIVKAELVVKKEENGMSMDVDDSPDLLTARPNLVSDSLPMLVPATGPVDDHATVFVNEPKLSDLKQILLNHGMSAEFVSGVLVVDNCVAIKRSETGRLILEGVLSKTYYNVRSVLYRHRVVPKGMKPTVDKILKDVQQLSRRMRAREETTEELIIKASDVRCQLEAMSQYREESMKYAEIAKRAEKSPRCQLVLCLAAENKQLEQLKMQNRTLEASLSEHQSALEMIMTKYREQVTKLMRTDEVERAMQRKDSRSLPNFRDNISISSINEYEQHKQLTDERLVVMAAIAQEVTDQSDRYSVELETELHRLRSENSGLRDLLAISSVSGSTTPPSGGSEIEHRLMNNGCNESICLSKKPTTTIKGVGLFPSALLNDASLQMNTSNNFYTSLELFNDSRESSGDDDTFTTGSSTDGESENLDYPQKSSST